MSHTVVPGFVEPITDIDSQPYWDAAREGRLLIQECGGCGWFQWPARSMCGRCGSRAVDNFDASGRGRIYSWIHVHHPTVPVPSELLPYTVVLVALDENPHILMPGQFDGDRAVLRDGARVTAAFKEASATTTVVHWRPSTDEEGAG